jgi:hypothetical protein
MVCTDPKAKQKAKRMPCCFRWKADINLRRFSGVSIDSNVLQTECGPWKTATRGASTDGCEDQTVGNLKCSCDVKEHVYDYPGSELHACECSSETLVSPAWRTPHPPLLQLYRGCINCVSSTQTHTVTRALPCPLILIQTSSGGRSP